MTRALGWEGCGNVRDLGGLRLRCGGLTRTGVIVRCDSLTRLTGAGREQALAYGVRRAVDLRAADEKAAGERWPDGVQVVVNPILPGSPDDPLWPQFGAIFDAAPDPEHGLHDVYVAFLERWPREFAAAVAAAAEPAPGCVAVHCNAGRDRAGLVSALLLDAIGVERDDIAQDFALTPAIDGHPGATAWVMRRVLATLDRTAGGSRGYLRAAGVELPRAAGHRLAVPLSGA
jgi:protein-tyrosine phosphatase